MLQRELAGDAQIVCTALSAQQLDIRNRSLVAEALTAHKPDVVINLAGVSSPASGEVSRLYEVNAFGHLNLLEAAAALNPKPTVMLASSAQLYGPQVPGKADEMTPLNPVSHYGLSKYLAEQYCKLFAAGLRTVIVRTYNAIGRGQSLQFLIPKVVAAFKDRKSQLEIGSFDVERDYIDVRDVAAMWHLLIQSKEPPSIVNFSNGETATLQTIIAKLSALTGHRLAVVTNEVHQRKYDIPYQCGDNTVIRKLGYSQRYSLDQTLSWMLNG
jgi:nucleoside-diphosphate-sugar epimerase